MGYSKGLEHESAHNRKEEIVYKTETREDRGRFQIADLLLRRVREAKLFF